MRVYTLCLSYFRPNPFITVWKITHFGQKRHLNVWSVRAALPFLRVLAHLPPVNQRSASCNKKPFTHNELLFLHFVFPAHFKSHISEAFYIENMNTYLTMPKQCSSAMPFMTSSLLAEWQIFTKRFSFLSDAQCV